ncbi:hypothetical protein DER29_6326 [Micromonospora sp. M71_S20]|uniref:hypothetical protein n=1 Tax=Micromonospora sp. M71_S20 TaxID=592872 RepID=UPI000EB40A79|nr:hypothetical protein [Micromonospora sp. M71_S20]RLK09764.1 hypothetical protein DER29_6326 [Micromonospora sp. M71_S20]
MVAAATVVPLMLVLSMHSLALARIGRFLALLALIAAVAALLWFFGLQVLDWYEAEDSGFHGFPERAPGFLIFTAAPGLGLALLAGRLEHVRRVARTGRRLRPGD